MARSLTAGVIAALGAPTFRAALFASFAFPSATTYLWSGVGTRTYGALGTMPAATWLGVGTFGGVSTIEETAEIRAVGVTYSLSGVALALLSVMLTEKWQGRDVTCWAVYFDANDVPIADAVRLDLAAMNEAELEDVGAGATVRLASESEVASWNRSNTFGTYTPEDQKRRYPGDRGLDYVPALIDKVIVWGRRPLTPERGRGASGGGAPAGGGQGRPGGGGGDSPGGFAPPRGPR